jgi:hypothetical protein
MQSDTNELSADGGNGAVAEYLFGIFRVFLWKSVGCNRPRYTGLIVITDGQGR